MSTNRTKIDWAYEQARKINVMVLMASNTPQQLDVLRKIAGMLRQAEKRGQKR